jgi:endonuclease I
MYVTDVDPFNSDNIILTYEGSVSRSTDFNKEHTRAKSIGKFGTSIGPGTDMHHLRPCNSYLNSTRNNYGFGEVAEHDSSTSIYGKYNWSTSDMSGDYLGTGSTINAKVFEPKDEFKGDVARMIFYMATRYDASDGYELEVGGTIPDGYRNFTSGAVGLHTNFIDLYNRATTGIDPVSDFEVNRNNLIDQKYQHNRNPFIDHPEFLAMIYDESYSGPGALEI